jgi:hypothetical protein
MRTEFKELQNLFGELIELSKFKIKKVAPKALKAIAMGIFFSLENYQNIINTSESRLLKNDYSFSSNTP